VLNEFLCKHETETRAELIKATAIFYGLQLKNSIFALKIKHI